MPLPAPSRARLHPPAPLRCPSSLFVLYTSSRAHLYACSATLALHTCATPIIDTPVCSRVLLLDISTFSIVALRTRALTRILIMNSALSMLLSQTQTMLKAYLRHSVSFLFIFFITDSTSNLKAIFPSQRSEIVILLMDHYLIV